MPEAEEVPATVALNLPVPVGAPALESPIAPAKVVVHIPQKSRVPAAPQRVPSVRRDKAYQCNFDTFDFDCSTETPWGPKAFPCCPCWPCPSCCPWPPCCPGPTICSLSLWICLLLLCTQAWQIYVGLPVVVIVYVIYLLECKHCRFLYLVLRIQQGDFQSSVQIAEYIKYMVSAAPSVEFAVECSHHTHKEDNEGTRCDEKSETIHSSRHSFKYKAWEDGSPFADMEADDIQAVVENWITQGSYVCLTVLSHIPEADCGDAATQEAFANFRDSLDKRYLAPLRGRHEGTKLEYAAPYARRATLYCSESSSLYSVTSLPGSPLKTRQVLADGRIPRLLNVRSFWIWSFAGLTMLWRLLLSRKVGVVHLSFQKVMLGGECAVEAPKQERSSFLDGILQAVGWNSG